MKYTSVAWALCASLVGTPEVRAQHEYGDGDPLAQVIAAERAFSAAAVERGTKQAFLDFFADDAVSFGPAPVVGRDPIREGPEMPPLEWWPAAAEVSAAGDLGYTTGPYRSVGPDGVARWGHYHSVWGRQADGGWKVLIDLGGPHGEVAIPETVRTPRRPAAGDPAGGRGARGAGAAGLMDADRACFAQTAAAGAAVAAERCAWPDARIYRFRQAPFTEAAAAAADQRAAEERLAGSPHDARVASSGDLGFTYGTGTIARTETGGEARAMSYARFWRRDGRGDWRVVVEIVLPHPPAPAGGAP